MGFFSNKNTKTQSGKGDAGKVGAPQSSYQPPLNQVEVVIKTDSSDDEMVVMERVLSPQSTLGNEVAFDENVKRKSLKPDVTIKRNATMISELDAGSLSNTLPTMGSLGRHIQRPDPTNPEQLVVGYLLQWKLAAEEGTLWLRTLTFLSALVVLGTSIAPFAMDVDWELPFEDIILAIYSFVAALIICLLEGRFSCCRSPIGCRAKLRDGIVRHVNVLRLVWGRGWFCLIAGLLRMSMASTMNFYAGVFMSVCGTALIISGTYSSHMLSKLRKSLSNDDFLWLEFSAHDYDNDGMINPSEFATFLAAIGIEFDDVYTLKSFLEIDKNKDQKITYTEFHEWWAHCRFDTNRGFDAVPDAPSTMV